MLIVPLLYYYFEFLILTFCNIYLNHILFRNCLLKLFRNVYLPELFKYAMKLLKVFGNRMHSEGLISHPREALQRGEATCFHGSSMEVISSFLFSLSCLSFCVLLSSGSSFLSLNFMKIHLSVTFKDSV